MFSFQHLVFNIPHTNLNDCQNEVLQGQEAHQFWYHSRSNANFLSELCSLEQLLTTSKQSFKNKEILPVVEQNKNWLKINRLKM